MPKKATKKVVAKLVEKEPEVVEETPESEPVVEEKPAVEPVDEFADVPETEEEPAKEPKYRGETVIGVETRIMNGRMYRDVRTVEATYLLTEEEFTNEVKYAE